MLGHIIVVLVALAVGAVLWSASPIVTLIFVGWILFATGGYVIGQPKGHGAVGITLASVAGPVGLLIVATMRPTQTERERASAHAIGALVPEVGSTRPCPWCAETIKTAAVICKHCGQTIERTTTTGT
jgi:hypothetical protein